MRISFFLFFLFLSNLMLFAQTSRFEKTFRESDGTLLSGATIYIINQSTSTQYDLTEHPTKTGVYYNAAVPYGEYDVYVNGSKVADNIWHGTIRQKNFIDAVDSDSDNKIESGSFEASAISSPDIASGAITVAKIGGGAVTSTKIPDNAILTAHVSDSNVTLPKLSTAVHNYIAAGGSGSITNNPDDVTIENKSGSTLGVKSGFDGYDADLKLAGILGDGSNETAAIQAVLNSALRVKIPPGHYNFSALTLNDGQALIGSGSDSTVFSGTITASGHNEIIGIKFGGMISTTGDTVNVKNGTIYNKDTYAINQSGGQLDLKNTSFVFNSAEPSINLTGGKVTITGGDVSGQKIYMDDAQLTINNVSGWTIANAGNYGVSVNGNSVLKIDNSSFKTVDPTTRQWIKTGYSGDLEAHDNSAVYISNSRYDMPIGVDDDAKIYLDNFTAKYKGRISGASSSTANALIKVRHSYLHQDNGFAAGSHIVEISSGGAAVFDIAKSTLEYMGDDGEYPMVGTLSAGGGTQIWTNVTLIDHLGASGGYSISCYGMNDAVMNNVRFYSEDVSTDQVEGAFSFSPGPGFKKFIANNVSIYFKPGFEDYRRGIHLTTTTRLPIRSDSIYVNVDFFGVDPDLQFSSTTVLQRQLLDSLRLAYKNFPDNSKYFYRNAIFYNDVFINDTLTVKNTTSIEGALFGRGPMPDSKINLDSSNVLISSWTDSVNVDGGDSVLVTIKEVNSNDFKDIWTDFEADLLLYRRNDLRYRYWARLRLIQLAGDGGFGASSYRFSVEDSMRTNANFTWPTITAIQQSDALFTFKVKNNYGVDCAVKFWVKPSYNVENLIVEPL